MRVNARDLAERVLWTTVQATVGALIVVLSAEAIGWQDGAKFVAVTALAAAAKVLAAQQVGDSATGDAWPGGTTSHDADGRERHQLG